MLFRSVWSWAAALVLGSLLFSGWHAFQASRQFRADLLLQAQGIAAGINPERIDQLTATAQDLESPAYHRISQQLLRARRLFPNFQYIYLMRRQPDGTVVFVNAAQNQTDTDAIFPGQPYPEASAELRAVLEHNGNVVEGPLADSWGSWVSALIALPTRYPTLLGMDVATTHYRQHLWNAAWPPLLLGAVFLGVTLGVRRKKSRLQAAFLTAVFGSFCTLQASWAAWTMEQHHRHQALLILAQSEMRTAFTILKTARDHLLDALVGLYVSSEEVTALEFFSFTKKWRAYPWLDVAGFVELESATLSPATHPGIVGWDVNSVPALIQARLKSLRTDLPTAALVPLFGRTTPSLLLFQPIWNKGRLMGHACLAVHLESLSTASSPGIRLRFRVMHPEEEPTLHDAAATFPLFIGGQVLAVEVTPTAAFLDLHPLHGTIATLVFGALLTAAAARLSLRARQRREILEQLVRKRTRELHRSLSQLRALFANAITGIAVHQLVRTPDGTPITYRYLDANPAFTSQTGISAETIVGKTVETALGMDTPPFLSLYAQVVDTQAPISMHTYVAPMERHFLINAFPLPDQDTFATVFLDTSVWVQTETALRQKNQFLLAILETLPLPVFIKDADGRYVEVNAAFCAFFGGTRDDYVGKTLVEAFPEPMAAFFQDKDREIWKTKGSQVYGTTVYRADGSPRRVLFHKRVVLDGDTPMAIVGAMTDVTELEEANQRLQQANNRLKEAVEHIAALAREAQAARKAKEQFLAMLSHDLRAPAASAFSAAHILAQEDLTPEAQTMVRSLAANSQAMLDLLEDALSLEALRQGALTLHTQPTDLTALVTETVASMMPLAHTKGLELTTLAPSTPMVEADPRRIRQILTNLVSNAVKFTPTSGQVHVELRLLHATETQVTMELRVTDTGPGIAAKDRERIFQRFEQASCQKNGTHGFGLGLALCRELAQAMGGDIGVDSEEGHGASFWVHLPFPHAASTPLQPAGRTPLRVLVVDDDAVGRTVTVSLIGKAGGTATAVDSGKAALATLMATPEPFHAAVIDLRMPDMDGITLARRIRQGHAGDVHTAMTLVALTASETDGPACAEAGFTAYLVKPVDAAVLTTTLVRTTAQQTTPGEAAR